MVLLNILQVNARRQAIKMDAAGEVFSANFHLSFYEFVQEIAGRGLLV